MGGVCILLRRDGEGGRRGFRRGALRRFRLGGWGGGLLPGGGIGGRSGRGRLLSLRGSGDLIFPGRLRG